MDPNEHRPTQLQDLPHDMLSVIVGKIGESSSTDFVNAISTCTDMRAAADTPTVYKKLSLGPLLKMPLKVFDHMALFNKCLDNENLEAHYIRGIISYFVEEDLTNSFNHLKVASDGGHKESTYLYGLLQLCHSMFDEGKTTFARFKWEEDKTDLESTWKRLRDTALHGVKLTKKPCYNVALRSARPPSTCRLKVLKNTCPECLHYKLMVRFIRLICKLLGTQAQRIYECNQL